MKVHALRTWLQTYRAAAGVIVTELTYTHAKNDRTSDQDSCGTTWKAVFLTHGMRGSGCNIFCWPFLTGEPVALLFPDLNGFAVLTLP